MIQALGISLGLLLAYANGANDQFKSVATLWGSRTLDFRSALWWSSLATILGGMTAVFLAEGLLRRFTGVGLVPDEVVGQPQFVLSVAAAAALTVFAATKLGLPISTTHALIGALFGAGWSAVGPRIGWTVLGKSFLLPLAMSPLIAAACCGLFYRVMHRIRMDLGWEAKDCLCVGPPAKVLLYPAHAPGPVLRLRSILQPMLVAPSSVCRRVYAGSLFGLSLQHILDFTHIGSAAAVAFARGLNDTPKIAALLIAFQVFGLQPVYGLVVGAMVLGGVLNTRSVAVTMSHRITPLNSGQGVCANLTTAFLVILASRFGVPVSTTHTSCGALFGIGLAGKKGRLNVMGAILSAWLLTLPLAAAAAAVIYRVSASFFQTSPTILPP